jgi:hypothetical protein
MNLMQIQDDLQSIPNTPDGMRLLMQYANGSNPSVVPEYIALGELSRRRQFESVAKQVAAGIPKTTVKDQLTQAPPMVNPAAGIAGVNPAAPPVPVNPMMAVNNPMAAQERPYGGQTVNMADGGLASVQEYLANRPGISSVPLNNMFNPSSYAGGGIVAFQDNRDQPVRDDMPSDTRAAGYAPRGRSSTPGEPSTFDNAVRSLMNRLSNINWLPSQEAELESLRQEGVARAADSARVNNEPGAAAPMPETYSLTPEQAELLANTTTFPESTSTPAAPPTASGQLIAADAAVSGANRPQAPRGPGLPSIGGAPAGGRQTMDGSDAQLLERRRALLSAAGVSADPFSEANKRQAAMEARNQAKYEQDPYDRLFGALSTFAKSDPTKGMAGLGTYTEASNLIGKEQNAYRDKQEQIAIDYQMAVAKEKDARARDDVKSVEAARAAQEKAKLDWAKLDLDRAQVGISASNANLKQLEYQLALEKAPLERQRLEAQIAYEKSKIPTADEKASIARQKIEETIRTNATREIDKDETIKYWSSQRNISDPATAAVLNSYIEELKDWHIKKATNPELSIPKPEAPVPGKKQTNLFGREKREFEGPAWVRPNAAAAPAPSAPMPAGMPSGSRMIGTSNGRPVYETPSGERFTTQ